MPLHGEAELKTYRGFRTMARGVVVAHHTILGENCVQKTYAPTGHEDAIAFAEPRLLNELDHPRPRAATRRPGPSGWPPCAARHGTGPHPARRDRPLERPRR
jgi:hypothetical protein